MIVADMGAGSGQVTHDWFDRMYPDVAIARIVFTAIGVVTADPGRVESVLAWADRLQRRVQYLIVENSITAKTDFTYWRASREAQQFQKVFQPVVIQMDYRLPELENATRNYGVTLGHLIPGANRAAANRLEAQILPKSNVAAAAQA